MYTANPFVSKLVPQRIAMSHPIAPAAEQASLTSFLPTHVLPQPQRAHTLPSAFSPYYLRNQSILSNADSVAIAHHEKKTWLIQVKEYATVIGVALTFIGVIVAIITVVKK